MLNLEPGTINNFLLLLIERDFMGMGLSSRSAKIVCKELLLK